MDFTTRAFLGAGLALFRFGLLHRRSSFLAAVLAGTAAYAALAMPPDAPLSGEPFGNPEYWGEGTDMAPFGDGTAPFGEEMDSGEF